MNELETYPMLAKWLYNAIAAKHDVFGEIKIETNISFNFGCRYEFDIIGGFETEKKRITRLYNIEVKIDGNIKGLMFQGFRNNSNWFDYTYIATPLNHYFNYYQHTIFKNYDFYLNKAPFGWLIFDFPTKRVWTSIHPKICKLLLGKRDRNKIITRLGLREKNLLGGY